MIDLPIELARDEPHVYQRVRNEGREFQPVDRPVGVRKPKDEACFRNAVLVLEDHPEWAYAEGFALNRFGLWIHHAWTVMDDDWAFDPTWERKGARYVGVTLSVWDATDRVLETNAFGSLL